MGDGKGTRYHEGAGTPNTKIACDKKTSRDGNSRRLTHKSVSKEKSEGLLVALTRLKKRSGHSTSKSTQERTTRERAVDENDRRWTERLIEA